MNIIELLKNTARQFPNQIAIVDEYGECSYASLYAEVCTLQAQLMKINENKIKRLGICYGNNRNFIIALFAGVAAGYVVMPIFDELTDSEIDSQLIDNKIHHFLSSFRGTPLDHNSLFCLEKISESEENELAYLCDDPVFIRPTSGTTGVSKGVLLSHKAVHERINAANKTLNLSHKDTVIWVLPMAFHFVVSLVLYIAQGCKIVVTNGLDGNHLINQIDQHKGTLLYASPLHIRLLTKATFNSSMSSIQKVISTTTAIAKNVCEEFYTRFGIPVSQAYGIIEIGLPLVKTNMLSSDWDSVGCALPDYEIIIVDDMSNTVPTGQMGHLGIRGVGMFSGYLNPLKKTEEIVQNGYFMTGDIAVMNELGEVKIIGRTKSMINVAGNKVFPQEVEFVIEQHPAVAQVKVFASTHKLVGEIVEANVVLHTKGEFDSEEIIRFCRTKLASYKVPQRIHIVDEIQLTKTGKIIR